MVSLLVFFRLSFEHFILGPRSYGIFKKQIPGPLDTESIALTTWSLCLTLCYVNCYVLSEGP